MIFKESGFKLKDGRDALLRSPCEEDAETMLQFIIKASGETDFLMKFPEEYADFTLEEKMGFRITGVKPDAIRMKDGTFVNEYMMVKRL